MYQLSLSTRRWQLSPLRLAPGPQGTPEVPEQIPATVPGCVHTDLLAAGLIPDPLVAQHELGQFWIGQSDWRYTCTLPDLTDSDQVFDRVDLVADGLDTIASLRVGDHHLGTTDNMHQGYRFDVTDHLGEDLVIDFGSPVEAANAMAQQLRPRHHDYPHPYNAIRKMACSFGWDWGIATASSGIWRDLRLQAWSTARLARVQTDAYVTPAGSNTAGSKAQGSGLVRVIVEIERAGRTSPELQVRAQVGETVAVATVPAGETAIEFTVDLDQVELWWPVGHGEPHLYQATISLHLPGQASSDLDQVHRKLGFRTVEWKIGADEHGIGQSLYVNGSLIEVRGVNWIPDDPFPHRTTTADLRTHFEAALAANLNLVRIWGGGVYESEEFYDLTDELGLLVWQDYLFACAAYAEEEPLFSSVIAEARENTARLGHRASLIMLNGNNENLEGYQNWGWQATLDGHSWGERYYYTEFPAIVAELAPTVPYLPGSPWTPELDDQGNPTGRTDLSRSPIDPARGSVHSWATWNRLPASDYRRLRARFVAEYGWQAPPAWSTLQSFGDRLTTPTSPGTNVHQKATNGNNNLTRGLLPNVALPADLESWHWAMQWNQAEAIRLAITWFRSLYPICTGNIVWQLNDCWPVISWAAIDSSGHLKPLMHAMAQANSPQLLTIQPIGDTDPDTTTGGTDLSHGLRVTVVNDTDVALNEPITVRRLNHAGEVIDQADYPIEVPARAAATVALGEAFSTASDPAHEFLLATCGQTTQLRAWWFFAPPRATALPPAKFTVETHDHRVTVTAEGFVRDLCLLADKADPQARVDSGMISLLPGESHTFTTTTALDPAAAERAVVSLNDLVNPSSQPSGAAS